MKTNLYHIAIVVLCFPLGTLAQQQSNGQELGFYTQLAFKDAFHEQSLQSLNTEDEVDFWKDQAQFEQLLKEKDAWAHQIYLNGKRSAYSEHHAQCNADCRHSDFYYRQASYYAINGAEKLQEEVVYSMGDVRTTPKH